MVRNAIKLMRKKAGITQSELAKEMGVEQSAVAAWETGKSLPVASKLPKLSKILRCSIDDLYETKEA